MAKRKALVTGGAGFIGSHLCHRLSENGYSVIAFDDLSNGSGKANLPKNIKFVKGSILNKNKFESICKSVNVVFHLAVKPLPMSFDKPEEVVRTNDYGTYVVAKICSELKKKLIHVSSSEVYGTAETVPMKEVHPLNPSTIYAASKASSEMYVIGFYKLKNLQTVIVRPFNSYGEFMRTDLYGAVIPKFFTNLVSNKDLIINGSGKQTRDFTFVDDTCNGIILADLHKDAIGNIFNIGQGSETSINQLAKIMIKSYERISGKKFSGKIKYRKTREGDVNRHLSDISKAKKELGYKPTIKIEKGIERYLKWCLD